MNKQQEDIRDLLICRELKCINGITKFGYSDQYCFYIRRLLALVNYPLYQARELVKIICRCAFNDETLTDAESVVIMETCLDPRLDNILLEVNYNEGW